MPRLGAIITAMAGGAASRAERCITSVIPTAAATARIMVGMGGWVKARSLGTVGVTAASVAWIGCRGAAVAGPAAAGVTSAVVANVNPNANPNGGCPAGASGSSFTSHSRLRLAAGSAVVDVSPAIAACCAEEAAPDVGVVTGVGGSGDAASPAVPLSPTCGVCAVGAASWTGAALVSIGGTHPSSTAIPCPPATAAAHAASSGVTNPPL